MVRKLIGFLLLTAALSFAQAPQYAPGSAAVPPSPVTNCRWNVIYNVTASVQVLSTTACPGISGRAITTTDAVVTGDRETWLISGNAGATALSIPQAGTTGFDSNFAFGVKVTGAGDVTITPAISTVDGNTTLLVKRGQNCTLTSIDNVNYVSRCASGQLVAGSNITLTPSANGTTIAAAGGTLTVNGAGSATNLSSTTPAAGSNGINATIQISGANASVEIVGDGNASNCLLGTGVFGACSAASVVATLPLFSVTSLSQASTQFFGSTVSGSVAGADIFSPFSGTISAMYCHGAPASGQTLAYTAYYDDATTTTVTCTITGTATNCSVTGLSVAIVAGHKLAIQDIASATTGSIGGARCDLKITGTS